MPVEKKWPEQLQRRLRPKRPFASDQNKRNSPKSDDPPRRTAHARRVTLLYGVRKRSMLAVVADFQRLGVDVHISSDDGSAGHHGLVTDLLKATLQELPGCRVACCGSEKMMEAAAHGCHESDVPCQVSLETPMACGIGICLLRHACPRRRRRTGVFDAQQIVF